jgi:hypothetical protein
MSYFVRLLGGSGNTPSQNSSATTVGSGDDDLGGGGGGVISSLQSLAGKLNPLKRKYKSDNDGGGTTPTNKRRCVDNKCIHPKNKFSNTTIRNGGNNCSSSTNQQHRDEYQN